MEDTAASLARIIGPLRRTLSRATRNAGGLPDIPDAQIELLRALTAKGSSTPGALADELGLARSTISNLLKAMTASGLVERTLDDGDGRMTTLSASSEALDRLARYDRASAAILQHSFAALSAEDGAVLAAAVPVLERLRAALDHPRD